MMKTIFKNVPDQLRPEVAHFAAVMEKLLRENDWKGGWKECDPQWLFGALLEEVGELAVCLRAFYAPDGQQMETVGDYCIVSALRELADIANVALMLFDVLSEQAKEALPLQAGN